MYNHLISSKKMGLFFNWKKIKIKDFLIILSCDWYIINIYKHWMLKINRLVYLFRETKKAKIYKKPFYEAIPHLHKPHYMDIHEGYKKRTKEEVKA